MHGHMNREFSIFSELRVLVRSVTKPDGEMPNYNIHVTHVLVLVLLKISDRNSFLVYLFSTGTIVND